MRKYKYPLIVPLLIFSLILISVRAYADDRDSIRQARTERLFGGAPVRTAVKLNKLIDGPVVMAMTFAESRYYPVESFRGFFVGPNVGFSSYTLSKGIHPMYWGSYSNEYQVGCNFMVGLTLGYAFTLTRHWGIELSVGGGFQTSVYEGHYMSDGSMYIGWNGSSEWIPYKAAVNIVYKW